MATENQTAAVVTANPTFELRRFAWGTPDRLEVSGTFDRTPDLAADAAPVLVVRAGDTVHRLPAVPESLSGSPADGRVWHGQFAWQEAPVPFVSAELQLAADLIFELPQPGTKWRRARPRTLAVQARSADEAEPRPETAQPSRDRPGPVGSGAASVGSQVELLAAQEKVREIRASLEQTQAELTRAREDLQAERKRRADDGERFREGLAKVRESAEHALTAEQVTVTQLGTDLRDAQGELASRAAQIDATRAELEKAHTVIDEARSDAERLLGRLPSIRAK